jgi:hypothetical protein
MIWSLMYDALSAHYSAREELGEITDEQLELTLNYLRSLSMQELAAAFKLVFDVDPPTPETL